MKGDDNMAREIPEGSVEIQKGLWLYSYKKTIGGTEYTFRDLYSSEGYCFYDNTLPEEQRGYYQYASLGLYTDVNNYTSIPLRDDIIVAGKPQKPEIA